jgi:hypothetical protein
MRPNRKREPKVQVAQGARVMQGDELSRPGDKASEQEPSVSRSDRGAAAGGGDGDDDPVVRVRTVRTSVRKKRKARRKKGARIPKEEL